MKLRLLRTVGTDAPSDLAGLIQRVATGDEAAFGQLYDQLSGMVYGVVLRVVRNPAIAEEVAQEAFVEMWRVATRFVSDRGSVHAWASTIAHRKAVDRVRSEQSRTNREDRDHLRRDHRINDPVSDALERSDTQRDVRAALETLTDAQREAVSLAYFGGNTYREVAVLLDAPEGTIKTRIRHGLIKMRDQLGSTS